MIGMLAPGELQRSVDSQERGMFASVYAEHGGGQVPLLLNDY